MGKSEVINFIRMSKENYKIEAWKTYEESKDNHTRSKYLNPEIRNAYIQTLPFVQLSTTLHTPPWILHDFPTASLSLSLYISILKLKSHFYLWNIVNKCLKAHNYSGFNLTSFVENLNWVKKKIHQE